MYKYSRLYPCIAYTAKFIKQPQFGSSVNLHNRGCICYEAYGKISIIFFKTDSHLLFIYEYKGEH